VQPGISVKIATCGTPDSSRSIRINEERLAAVLLPTCEEITNPA
jgi:hypothetical protein